ncbi:MAG: UDP-N-acetylmuramoyl-L-alanyl-D-glutamate--2,6-diaminopimelate ligase [Methylococcales bacterium]
MMLRSILTELAGVDQDIAINGLCLDSRAVVKGNAFIALAGSKQHGLSHAEQAIQHGASVIIYEVSTTALSLAKQITGIPVIAVDNLAGKLGEIAARFYGRPSEQISVIGITGTNGKTSCSQFLSQVLEHCGVIGTLGWGEWGDLHKTLNTTPDALAVQHMLAELKSKGNTAVAMEVSSHGLDQGRVNSVRFTGAVFTNISRDHLDYHQTMAAYLQAKLSLLTKPGLAFAVVNLDDPYSAKILAAVPENIVKWAVSVKGLAVGADEYISAANINHQHDGMAFDVRWQNQIQHIKVPLYGDFNIENVLLVLAVLLAMGMSLSTAAAKLALIKPVVGRMQRFGGEHKPLVFVDYAHTPDALDKVLSSLRKHCTQALWLVFGCGGNRDSGKRPQMGASAEQWADHVLVTDDNPRFEDAQAIVKDILAGCRSNKIEVVQDRAQAIKQTIARAAPGDYVVIAGKGHEQYQEINGVQLPFSDSACVLSALAERAE